jgi:hypothetical protein
VYVYVVCVCGVCMCVCGRCGVCGVCGVCVCVWCVYVCVCVCDLKPQQSRDLGSLGLSSHEGKKPRFSSYRAVNKLRFG